MQGVERKNVETCFDIKIRDFEDKWNTWKNEQTLLSIGKLDNKVKRLKIYSVSWSSTVITDETQLWKMVKREIISQRMKRNPGNSETSHSCCFTKSILKQSIFILQVIHLFVSH
ncbi:uncharacterized protein LOC127126010 [Lathyrus oleraceus]|uniref:Uncharacterized protein n=1 Tax=Pisum sativum TaxID=3888 RepID=A0A9D4XTR0_PEA|nr:uncharacterized protein LOC127126010 [Pisum sativum]KAI5426372.1 hypothetical protein KIW84_031971 [Pisum sativum]